MNAPAPTYTRYRVAAIQYEPSLGEKEKNVTDLLRLVEEAAQTQCAFDRLTRNGNYRLLLGVSFRNCSLC